MYKILKTISIVILFVAIIFFSQTVKASTVTIEADKQDFQVENNTAYFKGNVKVNFDNITISSMAATLTSDQQGEPEKAVFTDGVSAIMKADNNTNDDLQAETMTLMLASSQLIAQGNTHSRFKKGTPGAISVKADKQEFNNITNEIKAAGNVVIHYKDMILSGGNAVLINSKEGKPQTAKLTGHAKIIRGSTTITAGTLNIELNSNNINATGGVSTITTLKDTGKVSMTSSSQLFNKAQNIIIGSGNVKLVYQDYIATGPKATLNLGSDNSLKTIVFSGRSQIKDALRKVSANVITVTTQPKNFVAEGNVKTEFIKKSVNKPPVPSPTAVPVKTTAPKPQPTETSKPTPVPTEEITPEANTVDSKTTTPEKDSTEE